LAELLCQTAERRLLAEESPRVQQQQVLAAQEGQAVERSEQAVLEGQGVALEGRLPLVACVLPLC
jgi:hypothetical protein